MDGMPLTLSSRIVDKRMDILTWILTRLSQAHSSDAWPMPESDQSLPFHALTKNSSTPVKR